MNLLNYIDANEKYYRLTILFVVLSPFYWNIIGRLEYNTKFLSKIFGSPLNAVYFFGITIFLLSGIRNWMFEMSIKNQIQYAPFNTPIVHFLGITLLIIGLVLVFGSYYHLGFVNTFLGDYFGFLLDHKIETFPFSFVDNPMYWGSFLNFLGTSLIYNSLAGVTLSIWVWIIYRIAIIFEEPFTEYIYSKCSKTSLSFDKSHKRDSTNNFNQNGHHLLASNGYSESLSMEKIKKRTPKLD